MDGVLVFDVGSHSLTVLLAAPGIVWETSVITRLALGGTINPLGSDVLVQEASRIREKALRRVSSGPQVHTVGVGTGILRSMLPELVDKPATQELLGQIRESSVPQGATTTEITPEHRARLKALQIVENLVNLMEFKIISGTTEALLTARGVAFRLNLTGPFAVVDPGGATTELALVDKPEILKSAPALPETEGNAGNDSLMPVTESHPVGAFTAGSPEEARAKGREMGQRIASWKQKSELWGVGGTMTTLAAMDLGLDAYDSGAVNAHELTIQSLERLDRYILATPKAQLEANPVIGKRAEAMPVASSLVLGMAEGYGAPIRVADAGIRWGVAAGFLGWRMP